MGGWVRRPGVSSGPPGVIVPCSVSHPDDRGSRRAGRLEGLLRRVGARLALDGGGGLGGFD
eukprot:2405385-Prorocentrum_lima.AAC.1